MPVRNGHVRCTSIIRGSVAWLSGSTSVQGVHLWVEDGLYSGFTYKPSLYLSPREITQKDGVRRKTKTVEPSAIRQTVKKLGMRLRGSFVRKTQPTSARYVWSCVPLERRNGGRRLMLAPWSPLRAVRALQPWSRFRLPKETPAQQNNKKMHCTMSSANLPAGMFLSVKWAL